MSDSSNSFYVYGIDSTGVFAIPIQNIGDYHFTNGGMLTFNKDGTKMAYVDLNGLVELYDFDRYTGIINNPQ